jgi:hypothetical protein
MLLRLTDCDTGESTLDVVRIPEGYSLQLHWGSGGFSSIILDPEAAARLARTLLPLSAAPLINGLEELAKQDPYGGLQGDTCRRAADLLRTFLADPLACPQHPVPGRKHVPSSGRCIWCGISVGNNDHEADGA